MQSVSEVSICAGVLRLYVHVEVLLLVLLFASEYSIEFGLTSCTQCKTFI